MPAAQFRDQPPLPDRSVVANVGRVNTNVDVLVRLLYPCACYLCRKPFHVARPPDICGACRHLLRVPPSLCFRCAHPTAGNWCRDCRQNPPSFKRTHALCLYADGQLGQTALRRWKIGGEINTGRALARALGRRLLGRLGRIDGIVPIPGRRLPAARRGFDTAHLLATVLAAQLPNSAPVCRGFLRRQARWHWGGAGRRREARRQIRDELYRRGSTPLPKGCRLLLVDDIMTSQATARRCSDLLLAGGAGRIDVAVIGRTTNLTPNLVAEPNPTFPLDQE